MVTNWTDLASSFQLVLSSVDAWSLDLDLAVVSYESDLLACQDKDLAQAHWISIDIDLLRKKSTDVLMAAESLQKALHEGSTNGLL